MSNTLQITNKLLVTPLIDMRNATFAKHYCDGLRWSLSGDYKGDKPFLRFPTDRQPQARRRNQWQERYERDMS